jgi:hypothetical protein
VLLTNGCPLFRRKSPSSPSARPRLKPALGNMKHALIAICTALTGLPRLAIADQPGWPPTFRFVCDEERKSIEIGGQPGDIDPSHLILTEQLHRSEMHMDGTIERYARTPGPPIQLECAIWPARFGVTVDIVWLNSNPMGMDGGDYYYTVEVKRTYKSYGAATTLGPEVDEITDVVVPKTGIGVCDVGRAALGDCTGWVTGMRLQFFGSRMQIEKGQTLIYSAIPTQQLVPGRATAGR